VLAAYLFGVTTTPSITPLGIIPSPTICPLKLVSTAYVISLRRMVPSSYPARMADWGDSVLKAAAGLKRLSFFMRLMALLPENPNNSGSHPWGGTCLVANKEVLLPETATLAHYAASAPTLHFSEAGCSARLVSPVTNSLQPGDSNFECSGG
jgi:hypothetical protein